MATSRYDSLDNSSTSKIPTITQTSTQGGSSSNSTSSTRSRSEEITDLLTRINSTTNTTSNTNTNTLIREFEKQLFNIDTLSEAGRGAMDELLAQLMAGGTEEQRKIQEERLLTLQNLRAAQAQYTPERAKADAEGMMAGLLREGMEAGLPSILLAQAGAGSSGSALSALLSQDLATRSAQGAANAGVNAVGQYGNILASLAGQEVAAGANLEDLVTKALLSALQIDKGSMQRGSVITEKERREQSNSTTNSTSRTTGTEQTTGSTIKNQSSSGSQQDSTNQWGNSVSTTRPLPTGSMTNLLDQY